MRRRRWVAPLSSARCPDLAPSPAGRANGALCEGAAAGTRDRGYQACILVSVASGRPGCDWPSRKGGSPRGYLAHVRVLSCAFLCTPVYPATEGLYGDSSKGFPVGLEAAGCRRTDHARAPAASGWSGDGGLGGG